MNKIRIFSLGDSPALPFAMRALEKQGIPRADAPENATHLLLNVPTPPMDLEAFPAVGTVIGGNLQQLPDTYAKVDLLQDAQYVAENAALTADCALRLLGQYLEVSFRNCPILVIGWGRIGKCLAKLLQSCGAKVTVAARNPADRGMLTALGYQAVDIKDIEPARYRGILNTAPAPVLEAFDGDCVRIDLASKPGLAGEDVLWARKLPGKMLPESAGELIAQGVLRHLSEG